MTTSARFPWFARMSRPFFMAWTWHCSPSLRTGTIANARWLLGPDSTMAQRRKQGYRVIDNFYRFIHDVARCSRLSPEQLRSMIDRVEGAEHYDAARKLGRGVIVATAHMGSFEIAMASLRGHEPGPIHVLFHQDRLDQFQHLRRDLHRKLDIREVELVDGWQVWVGLRDALNRGEVVVLQVDRLMPGQKGAAVDFLGGHIVLPTGTVRLASLTGAPIVPVFSVREPDGKLRLIIEPAIMADASDDSPAGAAPKALRELAAVLEKYLARYPEQWLMLFRAWCEDGDES